MLLADLLAALPWAFDPPGADAEISGITDDSRQVRPGYLFVAVPGLSVDGHTYVPQALAAGAAAVVGTQSPAALDLPAGARYYQVSDARLALGWLHAAWQGFPSRRMALLGVTGTDGKTTTTNLLYAILRAAGLSASMISTVNAQIGDQSHDTGLHTTTPHADEVQHYLAEMVAAGTTHAVLEATSHGLAQHRLAGCDFDVAVVTNITHEHLDYHGTWEAYRDAKALLFRGLTTSARKPGVPKVAVLNADDPGSYEYLRQIPADRQLSYSLKREDADVLARDVVFTPQGVTFMLHCAQGEQPIHSPLVGAFNVSNILAATTGALALDLSLEAIATGVAAVAGVQGRLTRIDEGQDFTAIVDFAHTPNALRRVLLAARELITPPGRVIVAFGAAGLRDRAKRRMMGEIAAELADITVITAEDPRTESLSDIMADTAAAFEAVGLREGEHFWRVPDRGRALLRAVELARPGDVVLACGKGHEQSMCFGTEEYPWDDIVAMRKALHGEFLATLPTADEETWR